jgi:GT2 family glycosyltransferase
MISIVSLIYKSPIYADSVYDSVMEFTPLVKEGKAEFFFVANDATEKVINHLDTKGYTYYINNNPRLTDDELFAKGIAYPEYIHRVYRGWNVAIEKAKDIVVLVNSDNTFSPNWLEYLLKHSREDRVVCCRLVERRHPKHGVFPGADELDCGSNPGNYDKAKFLYHAERASIDALKKGGAYMPCLFYKKVIEKAGVYPEGNLAGSSFQHIIRHGDEDFFLRLKNSGVEHYTVLSSFDYHFKEGEMEA